MTDLSRFNFTKKIKNLNLYLCILLGLWWLLNVLVAGCSELANDEAYYYMFSQKLAWGYFDHPPMTVLLVYLGSFLGSELGVRFFFTLLQPLYLFILWQLLKPSEPTRRDANLFMLIAFSLPVLQLYGFLAVPDAPLMFTIALFLWAYRYFVKSDSWLSVLLLGAATAAMAYSKYHGALIVLFTVASNIRILRNPKVYVAMLVTAILIVPHILWQYQNDWVSFNYHLSGRNGVFRPTYILEYLMNLILIFNPFFFYLFVKGIWSKRRGFKTVSGRELPDGNFARKNVSGSNLIEDNLAQGEFDRGRVFTLRAIYLISAGFILFFLLSTLRGYSQPQWIIPAAFGVIAILFEAGRASDKIRRYIVTVAKVSFVLFILFRLVLIFNPLKIKFEVFDNKVSYNQIAQAADGAPVIFNTHYAIASKYAFYTDGRSYAQPSYYHRESQYSLMDDDTQMAGGRVMVEVEKDAPGAKTINLENGKEFSYLIVDKYIPVRKIEILTADIPDRISIGDTIPLHITIRNPYPYAYVIDAESLSVKVVWKRTGVKTFAVTLPDVQGVLAPGAELQFDTKIVVPELTHKDYFVGLTIQREPFSSWVNMPLKKVIVASGR